MNKPYANNPDAEASLLFQQRLKEQAQLLERYWGKSLAIHVVESPNNHGLQWDDVQIPLSCQSEGDNRLLQMLAHEWGHRCIAPVSLAQAFWWEILALIEEVPHHHIIVHMVSDLLVDGWYMNNPRWGGIVSNQLKKRFQRYMVQYADNLNPLSVVFIQCYIEMGRWHKSFRDYNFNYQTAESLVRNLFNTTLTLDERVRQCFKQLARIFKDPEKNSDRSAPSGKGAGGNDAFFSAVYPVKPSWHDLQWDVDDLIRLLLSKGIRLTENNLNQVLGKASARKVTARLKLLESITRVMPKVRKVTESLKQENIAETALWKLGESIHKLQAVKTLEQSGVIVPGITTLKDRYTQGDDQRPEMPSICLVVDNSGSTRGPIIQQELDAAVALIEAAKEIQSKVGLVVFGSHVELALEPSKDYASVEMTLAGLEGQSGGSELEPALKKALDFCPTNGEKQATIVFTDSYIFDTAGSVNGINQLLKTGPVVVFCVENQLDSSFIDGLQALSEPPRIISVSPDVPLVDSALKIFQQSGQVNA